MTIVQWKRHSTSMTERGIGSIVVRDFLEMSAFRSKELGAEPEAIRDTQSGSLILPSKTVRHPEANIVSTGSWQALHADTPCKQFLCSDKLWWRMLRYGIIKLISYLSSGYQHCFSSSACLFRHYYEHD